MDYFERVVQIIAEELNIEPESLTLSTHITDDLNADSLDAMEVILKIEEEFDVEIPDDIVQRIQTIADVVEFLDNHV
jgi:acyl carrier protein